MGGLLEACFSFLLTLTPYPKNVPFINSQLGSPHNNLATTLSVTQVTSPLKNAGYTAGWVCAAGSWIPEPTAQPHSRQSNPNPYPTTDSKLNWTYKFSHFFTPVYTLWTASVFQSVTVVLRMHADVSYWKYTTSAHRIINGLNHWSKKINVANCNLHLRPKRKKKKDASSQWLATVVLMSKDRHYIYPEGRCTEPKIRETN